jgi:sugar fermentation stimulation protein A
VHFDPPLVGGVFLRREKRFLVYARLDDGREVVAHTNNTGRMTGCLAPGARVWLSPADQPHRKLKWTLELAETVADETVGIPGGILVGLNTARANQLVAEALSAGRLAQLAGYPEVRAEVPVGPGRSRLDFLLSGHPQQPDCWVEVKNVTLVDRRHAQFPDAPSERGRKHLRELTALLGQGQRAALVFCIPRHDAISVGPADAVDPEYGRLLREGIAQGLEVVGARCRVKTSALWVGETVPLVIQP